MDEPLPSTSGVVVPAPDGSAGASVIGDDSLDSQVLLGTSTEGAVSVEVVHIIGERCITVSVISCGKVLVNLSFGTYLCRHYV